ncbi:hypothetical protein KV112_11575 [Mycolicibacter sp. MYC123]|uniref:Uncharacterized protein n=4 Tax=Mycolicibacter TaxID=1073531 RepID=A0A9X7IJI8_9MYCO|nr:MULTISPECIES: hypothetical protein [Mycobacteriaceae]KAA1430673.1 hypothetical protein F0402_12885 [Mycolicibacter arupensis]MCV7386113.1 hypothetical protein [Mycolicibacter longobardus]MEB3050368.1 hypothetical protein [Mycolicibacter sp. MYC123]ORW13393.1 hypothetical protein AWC16_04235 [Mycolicibacter longobardus]PQM50427.1 hypothetical protein C5U48_19990 [Mycolicibacter virginiensis]
MIPELDPTHGLLPPGRYRATRIEVRQRFVDGRGAHRQRLWQDWESATNLLRRHVHVNAAWLYGQFLSDDPEPQVVSCAYWAEDLELAKAHLNPTSVHTLAAFAQRGKVRRIVGVQVDTQLLAWHCQPDPNTEDRYLTPYLERRGQVDDYLQRIRCGTRGSIPARDDALPRRGYVEVIVDDYQ